METIEFQLKEEFIPLIQLLKYTGLAESGAMASDIVLEGLVSCNGRTELRKRYKVRAGDQIEFNASIITVHAAV